MSERRPTGALEAEVLAALWVIGAPASPSDVLEALDNQLAYTTVATTLGRLCSKGIVERSQQGRLFVYSPRQSRAEFTANRMVELLQHADDRRAALSEFVGTLSEHEERMLRDLLKDDQQ